MKSETKLTISSTKSYPSYWKVICVFAFELKCDISLIHLDYMFKSGLLMNKYRWACLAVIIGVSIVEHLLFVELGEIKSIIQVTLMAFVSDSLYNMHRIQM